MPIARTLGVLGVAEVVLVLRLGQPCPHQLAFPGLAALGFKTVTLAVSGATIGKKKFLAVQALLSGSGRLHRFHKQREPLRENRKGRRKKIHPKKTQTAEEGRRVISECGEENPREEDTIPDRQFCIRSRSTVATHGIVLEVVPVDLKEIHESCDRCGRVALSFQVFFDGKQYLCGECRSGSSGGRSR